MTPGTEAIPVDAQSRRTAWSPTLPGGFRLQ